MGKIHVHKQPDGWRAYIKNGHKVIIVDGFYDDEIDAAKAALATERA